METGLFFRYILWTTQISTTQLYMCMPLKNTEAGVI